MGCLDDRTFAILDIRHCTGHRDSTLNPGGHLAGLDVACLLPFHLSRITSDAAGCEEVSDEYLMTAVLS